MGYDSRVYVVSRQENKERGYGQIVAMFDCAVMGYGSGWTDLFKEVVKYDVYIENGDMPTREDMYGDLLKEASIESVINWLDGEIKRLERNGDYYRRLPPLLALLKGFNIDDWKNGLYVVHYGY